MPKKIQLGYWDFRGRGQVLRHLLSYTGLQWEETIYKTSTDTAKWFENDKKTLGIDFPNLPYLIDGDFKLTQTVAIAQYVIAKSGKNQLLGKDFHDLARINEIVGVFEELRTHLFKLYGDKGYESKLKETWQVIEPKLQSLDKFIGKKDWALGELTLADFEIAEWSAWIDKLYPQECKTYPSLQRIRGNFNKLEKINDYYKRPNAVHGPYAHPAYSAIEF